MCRPSWGWRRGSALSSWQERDPTLACDAVDVGLAGRLRRPIGSLAFLLLGGPLGVLRPRDLNRRLTGGWAFLIALVFLGGPNTG